MKVTKCLCGSDDWEVYENNGAEYMCKKCKEQFVLSNTGGIIWL